MVDKLETAIATTPPSKMNDSGNANTNSAISPTTPGPGVGVSNDSTTPVSTSKYFPMNVGATSNSNAPPDGGHARPGSFNLSSLIPSSLSGTSLLSRNPSVPPPVVAPSPVVFKKPATPRQRSRKLPANDPLFTILSDIGIQLDTSSPTLPSPGSGRMPYRHGGSPPKIKTQVHAPVNPGQMQMLQNQMQMVSVVADATPEKETDEKEKSMPMLLPLLGSQVSSDYDAAAGGIIPQP